MFPTRFLSTATPARLGGFLTKEDPLADAVVAALAERPREEQEALISQLVSAAPGPLPHFLAALRESIHGVPIWFDEPRANAGGEVVLRTGVLSGVVLGFKSLVLGYCSPAGNKPLALTRRLTEDVTRRLAETARFVEAVSHPGGLRPGAPGFVAAVRVRLIHARVRHALRGSPQWRAADWGAPINQYDMAGTVLLFSSVLLEGLRQLGAVITTQEEDASLHLWRRVGQLMGVDDELLSTSPSEARSLWAMIESTQALPDVDSRALTHALVRSSPDAPEVATEIGYALCRHLIGPRYADALELPRGGWDHAPRVLQAMVHRFDRLARRVPGARSQALRLGTRYWRRTVEMTLGAREVRFELPTQPLRAAGV